MTTGTAPLPPAQDLSYPLRWRTQSILYGHHRAVGSSDSGRFRGFQPFSRLPDIRRLDLRRSLRDPFQQWVVRDYEPRNRVQIHLLVDISASMQAGHTQRHLDTAAQLCALVAQAAHQNGDALLLYACGRRIEYQSGPPGQRARAQHARQFMQWFQGAPAHADSAAALLNAAAQLKRQRSLVFLLSDFLFDTPFRHQLMQQLHPHDVIPVVFDNPPSTLAPSWGLTLWQDAETREERLLLMRPSVQRRWQARREQQQSELDQLLRRYGCAAFRPGTRLAPTALARHLMER